MSDRTAITVNFDYQERAREFTIDDWVMPIGADSTDVGRVLEVQPGLGTVDVEWATGYRRMNVEDIIIIRKDGVVIPPLTTENIPGGPPVRPGREANRKPSAARVAAMFLKEAVYWANKDRGYRSTRMESESRNYNCPKPGCDHAMRRAPYKREEGKSTKLLVCPGCMFMIRVNDVHGHHQNIPEEVI